MQIEDDGEGVPVVLKRPAQAADSSVSDPTAENVRIGVSVTRTIRSVSVASRERQIPLMPAVCPRPF